MSPPRILVVEDEPSVLLVLQRLLIDEGYEVVTAGNGKEGLERVSGPSGPPQVILADISMPQIDGFELCRQVRRDEATRSIPFIFITAKSSARDRARAYGLGGQRFITKPFTRLQVLGAVRLALSDFSQRARLEDQLTLSGKLAAASIYFWIEFFFLRRWQGRIRLSREGQEGIIVFDRGAISSASLGQASGEGALESMLSWVDGSYTIEWEG